VRILLAEDDPQLAEATSRGLSYNGFAVDISPDGDDAIYRAGLVTYDVIVLDRDMPKLHGDEVCRLLAGGESRIIMLTALSNLEDRVAGLNLGADDYLAKPFALSELVARIRALGPDYHDQGRRLSNRRFVMTGRLGLKTRTALIFAAVFAVFAIAAASANYGLLRRALGTGQGGPSVEELSTALQEVAAASDLPVPELFATGDAARLILGPDQIGDQDGATETGGVLYPLLDRTLDDGRPASLEIEEWLADRQHLPPMALQLDADGAAFPGDSAAFDEAVLGSLASLEPVDPGLTSDFLAHLAALRTEGGAPLFPEPIRADGDICRAVFPNCDAALIEMSELASLSTDGEFMAMLDEAFTVAGERTREQALTTQLRISSMVALLSTLAAGAAAWFVARRMLRPIAEVTSAARDASADNLSARIAHDGPTDELGELADTFDQMLARLERSFESSSRFGSNAAHELKTPLALIRAEVDAHRADPRIVERERALLDRLEHAVDRSDRLVNALLALSRAEAGLQLDDRVDLSSVVTDALLDHAEVFSKRDLTVDYQADNVSPERLVVHGDRSLLGTLAHNLVENASKYAVIGSEIEVEIREVAGRLRLRVENRSEPIEVDDPMTLTEPFNRAEARSGVGGHGLGLSIVGAIARAHDAKIAVGIRSEGFGFVVTIDFPRSAAPTWFSGPREASAAEAYTPAEPALWSQRR